jgi:exopolysaccharide production protein ExoQ
MLMYISPGKITDPRLENKIFRPEVTAIALGSIALRNRSRVTWPPHIVWFAAYVALASAGVLWSFKPEMSFNRLSTKLMMLVTVILPAMLVSRKADIIPGMILGGYSTESMADGLKIGYPGYFSFKGELGEFASFAFLLSIYESFYPGWRRVVGLIVVVISIYLIIVSESKGSLGCAILAAILAALVLFVGKKTRVSPPIVLLPLLICYAVLSQMVGNLISRISWYIYGNYTLSGRIDIWDFVNFEIAKRPFLGWGYRSIWLVGPDSPVFVDGRGWITKMPSAHNGYLDTILDTGHIGLALFLVFVVTTLYAIGRVTDRDAARAWLLLSIALFIILVNFMDSGWMRGADALWLMFVVVVVDACRYWQPFHGGLGAARSVLRRPAIAERPPLRGDGRLLRRRDNWT